MIVSGIINAAYPYAPAGGIVTTTAGNVPENSVVAFNQADCPAGWVLADGSNGTPDLRGIFIRGAGISGVIDYANGTDMSATFGEYMNDSFQSHKHDSWGAFGQSPNNGQTPYSGTGWYSDTGGHSIKQVTSPVTDGTTGEPRTGAETAPASYALIYCVKTAEDSASSNSIWQTLSGIVSLVNSSRTLEVENLNVSGNLTGGSPVKIKGGLNVMNDSGSNILFIDEATGDANFSGDIISSNIYTQKGTVSLTDQGSAVDVVTLAPLASGEMWIFSIDLPGGVNTRGIALVASEGSSSVQVTLIGGGFVTISSSGTTVRAASDVTGSSTRTWYWSLLKLS